MKSGSVVIWLSLISSISAYTQVPECKPCSCCLGGLCQQTSTNTIECIGLCNDGYWGQDCSYRCPDGCLRCQQYPGDKADPDCYLCKDGHYSKQGKVSCNESCPDECIRCFADDQCTACKDGYYILNDNPICSGICPLACASCSSTSVCARCKPGYYNSGAVTNCSLSCPSPCSGCSSTTNCTSCRYGYYSDGSGRCSPCPTGCVSCTSPTGQCSSCKPDFKGGACEHCVEGKYGDNCNSSCQYFCKDNICDRVDGLCPACNDGYFLDATGYCIPCNDGCATCFNASQCSSCKPDFTGDKCELCIDGKYGNDCTLPCKQKCYANTCRKRDGLCMACIEGLYLQDGGYCTECPKGCKSCVGPSKCSICNPGFTGTICKSCLDGKYGDNCDYDCPDNCQTCSSYTYCTQCKEGFYNGRAPGEWFYCTDCCHSCPARCSSCTSSTSCTTCRSIHFTGKTCQNCVAGKYDTECENNCPINCNSNGCYRDTGNCFSCSKGFAGNKCGHCIDGKYGDDCNLDCSKNCNKCKRNNGVCTACGNGYYLNASGQCVPCHRGCELCTRYNKCSTCKVGFTGAHCDSCVAGKHGINCNFCSNGRCGENCDKTCPENCLNSKCDSQSGNCAACKVGFYGQNCTDQCSFGCTLGSCFQYNGSCLRGCLVGYSGDRCCIQGDNCETCSSNENCATCMPGWHGVQCNQKCPENCTDDGCSKKDGECSNCRSHQYGIRCENACSLNCLQYGTTHRCDAITGSCTGQCVSGYYGEMCDMPCSSNCNNRTCSKDGRSCLYGCVLGFSGTSCSEETIDEDSTNTLSIVGIAAGCIIGLAIVVLLIVQTIFKYRSRVVEIGREGDVVLDTRAVKTSLVPDVKKVKSRRGEELVADNRPDECDREYEEIQESREQSNRSRREVMPGSRAVDDGREYEEIPESNPTSEARVNVYNTLDHLSEPSESGYSALDQYEQSVSQYETVDTDRPVSQEYVNTVLQTQHDERKIVVTVQGILS